MKKKFYNGLLLVAMIFATVGSFVSCKDYNEDLYAELQGTLTDRIKDNILYSYYKSKGDKESSRSMQRKLPKLARTNGNLCRVGQKQLRYQTRVQ